MRFKHIWVVTVKMQVLMLAVTTVMGLGLHLVGKDVSLLVIPLMLSSVVLWMAHFVWLSDHKDDLDG